MRLCTGRPRAGAECGEGAAGPRSLGAAAAALLSGLLPARSGCARGAEEGEGGRGRGLGRRERAAVRAADAYIAARMRGSTDEVLRLVAQDVRLTSSRDGRVAGKRGFREYLLRTPASGTWERAFWNFERRRAEVRGRVKVFVLRVDVVARFGLDRLGKINDIYVGTTR